MSTLHKKSRNQHVLGHVSISPSEYPVYLKTEMFVCHEYTLLQIKLVFSK